MKINSITKFESLNIIINKILETCKSNWNNIYFSNKFKNYVKFNVKMLNYTPDINRRN